MPINNDFDSLEVPLELNRVYAKNVSTAAIQGAPDNAAISPIQMPKDPKVRQAGLLILPDTNIKYPNAIDNKYPNANE
jgi:hypothetical protein